MVDTHVHVNDPGRTEWEGFASATRAAAAGGVTTIIDMPLNSMPPTVDAGGAGGQAQGRRAENAYVDVGFWGGADPGQPSTELRACTTPACSASSASCCTRVSTSSRLWTRTSSRPTSQRAAQLRRADDRARRGRGRDRARAVRARRELRRRSCLPAARRRERRHRARHRAGALDRRPGAHPAPVQLRRAADDRERAARRRPDHRRDLPALPGLHLRGDRRRARPSSSAARRSARPTNRELLWQGLADGTIDCIVSDHSPCTPELKRLDIGDFGVAWGGIASLQVALPAVWTEARRRGFDAGRRRPVDVPSVPAALAGLTRKGRLAVGCDADLSVFAPDEAFVVDAARLRHRNPVTPYAGGRSPASSAAPGCAARNSTTTGTAVGCSTDGAGRLRGRSTGRPQGVATELSGAALTSSLSR